VLAIELQLDELQRLLRGQPVPDRHERHVVRDEGPAVSELREQRPGLQRGRRRWRSVHRQRDVRSAQLRRRLLLRHAMRRRYRRHGVWKGRLRVSELPGPEPAAPVRGRRPPERAHVPAGGRLRTRQLRRLLLQQPVHHAHQHDEAALWEGRPAVPDVRRQQHVQRRHVRSACVPGDVRRGWRRRVLHPEHRHLRRRLAQFAVRSLRQQLRCLRREPDLPERGLPAEGMRRGHVPERLLLGQHVCRRHAGLRVRPSRRRRLQRLRQQPAVAWTDRVQHDVASVHDAVQRLQLPDGLLLRQRLPHRQHERGMRHGGRAVCDVQRRVHVQSGHATLLALKRPSCRARVTTKSSS
jgi:hypothetical protein